MYYEKENRPFSHEKELPKKFNEQNFLQFSHGIYRRQIKPCQWILKFKTNKCPNGYLYYEVLCTNNNEILHLSRFFVLVVKGFDDHKLRSARHTT